MVLHRSFISFLHPPPPSPLSQAGVWDPSGDHVSFLDAIAVRPPVTLL